MSDHIKSLNENKRLQKTSFHVFVYWLQPYPKSMLKRHKQTNAQHTRTYITFPSRTHHHHSLRTRLHPTLHLRQQTLQLLLRHLHHRPTNPQSLLLIRLRDDMEMHMVHQLMRLASVVLQQVIIRSASRRRDPLGHRQDLRQVLVRDVGQLGAVEFGDDELCGEVSRERERESLAGVVGKGGDIRSGRGRAG
jgi:hypothetical protein